MSSVDKCRECGTAIPADSPGGFCAQCLLGLGLEKVPAPSDISTAAATDAGLPGPEEAGRVSPTPPAKGEEGKAAGSRKAGSGAHSPTEKPGDRIGRYRLLQEIGHGG